MYDSRIPIEYETCGPDGQLGVSEAQMNKTGIAYYECIKNKNLTIVGSYYDSRYRFIETSVKTCSNDTFVPNERA